MRELLAACRDVAANNASLQWADDAFLLEHKVAPWSEMPLWIPERNDEKSGFLDVPIGRARLAGLTFRSMAETIRDTLRVAPQASRRSCVEGRHVRRARSPAAGSAESLGSVREDLDLVPVEVGEDRAEISGADVGPQTGLADLARADRQRIGVRALDH